MPDEMGIFEAMYSQRAIRRLKPDPIPDELVRKVIEAGTRAPNGANVQNWAFVVVKDPGLKRKIAEHYKQHSPFRSDHAIYASHGDTRMRSASQHLDEHIQDAPVLILACIKHDGSQSDIARGASIYPAVQNMLLAARALGLGSVITTRQRGWFEKEIKELLSLRLDPSTTCADVKRRAEAKITNIEGKVRSLQRMKRSLVKLTKACSGSGSTSECPILESLERNVVRKRHN